MKVPPSLFDRRSVPVIASYESPKNRDQLTRGRETEVDGARDARILF